MDQEGAMEIMELSRHYGTVGSVYREVARFLQLKRTAQTIDGNSARSDLLRRKAESKMQIGGPFPEIPTSALCMQTAPLFPLGEITGSYPRTGEFGNFCCCPTNAAFFGPRCGAVRLQRHPTQRAA